MHPRVHLALFAILAQAATAYVTLHPALQFAHCLVRKTGHKACSHGLRSLSLQAASVQAKLNIRTHEVFMPALSSTMSEGKIVQWLKAVGDRIEKGEGVMVVESDKADMDVEAFEEGYMAAILVPEGGSAVVGATVALIAERKEDIKAVQECGLECIMSGDGNRHDGTTTVMVEDNNVMLHETEAPPTPATTSFSVSTKEIFMPALSSTMVDGKITQWLKKKGDKVRAGEAVMVVESDKADMDVESFEDGYIAEILVPEGGSAPVGSTCARLVANLADIDKVSDSTPVTSVAVSVDPAGVVAPAMPSETSKPSVPYKEIFMPALSSTMIDGKIVTWTKKIGDKVAARETVMVVESDKADMDVEAFEDGILAAIITGEGESAPIGSTVGLLASKPDDMAALQAYAAQLKSATVPAASAPTADVPTEVSTPLTTQAPPVNTAPLTNRGRISVTGYAKRLASEAGINLQTVRGSGPSGRIVASDVENAVKSGTVSGATLATQSTYTPAAGVLAATPSARALANQHNVDLGSIKGTGNFGRVTADDVRAAVGLPPLKKETEAVPAKEAITVTAKSASPSGKDSAKTASSPEEIVAMDGMQKAVVKNMVATLSVPVFRVSRAIVTDKFDELYKELKPKGVTVSAMLAKAVAIVLEKHPIVNAKYDAANGGGIKYSKDVNVAMAVAIDGGLITPTIHKANELDLFSISRMWKELVKKAQEKKLSAKEYTGGTFMISNLGMFGVNQFDAILPPDCGSILAVASSTPTVVQLPNGFLGVQKQMTVTITCDHRHIYGAHAAEFLKDLAALIENEPHRLTMG